jgi:hypothetical protein
MITPVKGGVDAFLGKGSDKNLSKVEIDFGKNIMEIPKISEDGNYQDENDDFEHLVFDIEEVECRMTDIEERDRNDESRNNRSIRGSIF